MPESKSGRPLPSSVTDFANSAQNLSKSPLGIIALFIVLIYGMACIVMVFSTTNLESSERKPLILFLALFPCLVFIGFCILVAYHHTKLYAPRDFTDETNFRELASPPRGIADTTKIGVAVSDDQSPNSSIVPPEIASDIDRIYSQLKTSYWLIHSVEVLRMRDHLRKGRFRVRVWIESDEDVKLDQIERVTYRLWDNFRPNQITTTDVESQFDVWVNTYGEFPILALISLKNGTVIPSSRYLDLPGRPPD